MRTLTQAQDLRASDASPGRSPLDRGGGDRHVVERR